MRRLILLDSALADFASIFDYIARESGSRVIGRGFVNRLLNQCKKLASLPGTLGWPRPELRPDIRIIPTGVDVLPSNPSCRRRSASTSFVRPNKDMDGAPSRTMTMRGRPAVRQYQRRLVLRDSIDHPQPAPLLVGRRASDNNIDVLTERGQASQQPVAGEPCQPPIH